MTFPQYTKLPVTIEAVRLQWQTWHEMCEFLGDIICEDNPAWNIPPEEAHDTCGECGPEYIALKIPTLEGDHTAVHGDYIIKGIAGEFYPCHPDIFAATYRTAAGPVASCCSASDADG